MQQPNAGREELKHKVYLCTMGKYAGDPMDNAMDVIEAYAKQTAIQELEKLPTLIARIKDQENTPEYLVVDAREITKAIARLNEEHDQPNN